MLKLLALPIWILRALRLFLRGSDVAPPRFRFMFQPMNLFLISDEAYYYH